jgi:hypothetical protein
MVGLLEKSNDLIKHFQWLKKTPLDIFERRGNDIASAPQLSIIRRGRDEQKMAGE